MQKDKFVWFRNDIISEKYALVNIMSPTAQFGLNVFEGIRCYWNKENKKLIAVKLDEHVMRLLDSCKLIGINHGLTKEEIINAFKKTIEVNAFKNDIAVRVIIFGDGIGSWHSQDDFSLMISAIYKKRTIINKSKGLSAVISSWERINDNSLSPRAKVGANYINSRNGYLQAKKDGYDVPIFLGNDGKVSESSGACIFIVKRNILITPDVTSSILISITRNFIIKIATVENIEVIERKVDRTELYLADEIFLCGTAAEITPITSIDQVSINNGKPGKITLKLLEEYLSIVTGKSNLYSDEISIIG